MLSDVHMDVDAEELFAGPGEMRALCRARDWSATPFGPVNQWPTSLRALVAALLASRHPMFLWWGPELAQLYNDAYRPSFGLGDRHPRALGMRGAESWTEIWHIIGPQIEQIMGGGEATWHEDQLVPIERNGQLEDVWWTYSFGPAFDDSGAVAGVLVVCQETTARVLTEHRLEQAAIELEKDRSRLLSAFTHAPAFLAILRGPPFVFEFANDAYYKLVGRRELIGRKVFDAVPEARDQGFMELLEGVVDSGQPFVGREMPFMVAGTADAPREERLLDFVYFPMIEGDGTISGVLAHGVDVTDHVKGRREVERLLAESEKARREAERSRKRIQALQALTAALAESWTMSEMADVIAEHATAVLSAVGVIIARVSPSGEYLEVVGAHPAPAAIDNSWRTFPITADVPLAEAFRTGEPVYLHSRAEWNDRYPDLMVLLDETGHQANIVLPLVVSHQVVGVIGAAFDEAQTFTDEDRAIALAVARQCSQALDRARLFESERKARALAESANRVKADFLASMSHEFRTPLNAIAGYAQLLELGIHGPVTAEQLKALGRIQRSEEHLLSLVNDVLNFAKIEAGKVEYDMTVVDLADAIAGVTAMVEPQLAAKGLVCHAEVPRGIMVRADREKLHQILLNLFSNSIKFTSNGGHITVEHMRRQGMPPSHVFLRVTDTGVGIPRDEHAAVFEPFVQLRRSRTELTEGTGLGLAISRDLARGMGGDLRVRSEEGYGSAFTLTLNRG